MLRLQLLGTPLVEHPEASIERFRSRKIEALFYYLAVNPEPHRRTKLATLLWSETTEINAQRNLRYALWNLRQILGDIPLHSDRLTVELPESDQLVLDTAELAYLLADDHAVSDDLAEVTRLEKAIGLYGGAFLSGFEIDDAPLFEEWLSGKRLKIEGQIVDVLTRLAGHYITQRQLPEAIDITQQLLQLDPWQEDAHRQLLTLMVMNGHREMAITHYQQFAETLASELGIEPEAETVALLARIRSGQLKQAIEANGRDSAENSEPDIPFIGRRKEYVELTKRWENAVKSESGLVLIRGVAGVGKTRLVEELSRYALLRGGQVLKGRCYEFSGTLPFHAIAMALEPLVPIIQSGKLPPNQVWLNELSQLMPELRQDERQGRPRDGLRQETDRYRLFEAVVQLLDAVSSEQPLLLALDDLHWADSETLDLLGYIVRRLSSTALLVVGTYRPGETAIDHALVALRRPLYNAGLDVEIDLQSLSYDAVGALVEALDSAENRPELISFLHEISQGNPFILVETLNEMQDRHWLKTDSNNTFNLTLPDECIIDTSISRKLNLHILCAKDAACQNDSSLRIAYEPLQLSVGRSSRPASTSQLQFSEVKARIARRIARLSPQSKQLLAIAAISGYAFDTKLLELASGLSPFEVIDCLEDWVARHLVTEVNENTSARPGTTTTSVFKYDFSHDLIRSVAYHELSPIRKRVIHLQLGNALEARYAGRISHVIQRLAYHYHQAGDAPKALYYLHLAGQQARDIYALTTAQECFKQAIGYWEQLNGHLNDNAKDVDNVSTEAWRMRWDLIYSLNEVNRILGQKDTEDLIMMTVADEVPNWGDEGDRLRMIKQQLAQLEFSADLDKRRSLAREGLKTAQHLGDASAEADFLFAWADCDRDMGNHEEAIINYEKAIGHFIKLAQPQQLALSLIGLGKIHTLNNRYGQALDTFERASLSAKEAGSQDVLVWSLNAIAELFLYIGNLESALNISQNALDICDRFGLNVGASSALVIQATIHLHNESVEVAEQLLEQARDLALQSGQSLRMADVHCCLGHLEMVRGNYRRALEHFDDTEALSGSFYHGRAIEARSYRAIAHLNLGELNEALVASHHAMVWLIGREQVMFSPQRICWNQYVVMLAHWEGVEAQEALVKGFRMVREQMESISEAYPSSVSDTVIKTNFLTNIPWNQEIVTIWDMLPLTNSHSALHFAG